MKTALLLCSVLALAGTVSAKVTENFAQTYPLEATGTIHLENVNGSVEIVAWDKAELARLHALLDEASAGRPATAARRRPMTSRPRRRVATS